MTGSESGKMLRTLWLSITAAATLLIATGGPSIGAPMTFRAASTGGTCSFCGWIAADGEITQRTPSDFKLFLQKDEVSVAPGEAQVVINSSGGNPVAAIALGELFRRHMFIVAVGKTVREDGYATSLVVNGKCISACILALAGGVEREVDNAIMFELENQIGVHQFQLSPSTANSTSRQSPPDIGGLFDPSQPMQNLIVDYMLKMGISPELLRVMSNVPANQVRYLTVDEAKRFKLAFSFDSSSLQYSLPDIKYVGLSLDKLSKTKEITNRPSGRKTIFNINWELKGEAMKLWLEYETAYRYGPIKVYISCRSHEDRQFFVSVGWRYEEEGSAEQLVEYWKQANPPALLVWEHEKVISMHNTRASLSQDKAFVYLSVAFDINAVVMPAGSDDKLSISIDNDRYGLRRPYGVEVPKVEVIKKRALLEEHCI